MSDDRVTIGLSKFVRRQTKESRFSHYSWTEKELLALVGLNFHRRTSGYRDGVCLVPVPPKGFYTATMPVTPRTKLKATFEARQKGEEKHLVVTAQGKKKPAKHVNVVLYHKSVLAEDNDRSTDDDYEVVSVNAELDQDVPMHPLTMARNMLHKQGGTQGTYTAEQFAEAVWYWSKHCMIGG